MEFDQIVKRLDWLDEEHRKSKNALTDLEERLTAIEGEMKALNKKIRQLGGDISSLSTTAARVEQFDTALAQQRTEITKIITELEKRQAANQKEIDKRHQLQIDGINKSITDLRKIKETITEMKRESKVRNEEQAKDRQLISEWEARMEKLVTVSEEEQRAKRLAEESRRQENKRISDLQGDVSAMRKRMDEVREKSDLYSDDSRRVETRLNEILTSEAERRASQTNFLETQARLQVERDRVWKQWEERFESLQKNTDSMDSQMAQWDAAQRAVKRAQETYEEIVQKYDRRINEITEMQRLAEDRFRQEWVTFKADDQKRWTSYTVSQDEIQKDTHANVDKMQARLTAVEDLAQSQQDVLQQTKEANEQLFQGMLAQIHELLSAYERIMGTK